MWHGLKFSPWNQTHPKWVFRDAAWLCFRNHNNVLDKFIKFHQIGLLFLLGCSAGLKKNQNNVSIGLLKKKNTVLTRRYCLCKQWPREWASQHQPAEWPLCLAKDSIIEGIWGILLPVHKVLYAIILKLCTNRPLGPSISLAASTSHEGNTKEIATNGPFYLYANACPLLYYLVELFFVALRAHIFD